MYENKLSNITEVLHTMKSTVRNVQDKAVDYSMQFASPCELDFARLSIQQRQLKGAADDKEHNEYDYITIGHCSPHINITRDD